MQALASGDTHAAIDELSSSVKVVLRVALMRGDCMSDGLTRGTDLLV